jgi:hypothetical protein
VDRVPREESYYREGRDRRREISVAEDITCTIHDTAQGRSTRCQYSLSTGVFRWSVRWQDFTACVHGKVGSAVRHGNGTLGEMFSHYQVQTVEGRDAFTPEDPGYKFSFWYHSALGAPRPEPGPDGE